MGKKAKVATRATKNSQQQDKGLWKKDNKQPPKLQIPSLCETTPRLRFTPYAWAKLQFMRDRGLSEVGCFGIAASMKDLLLVADVQLVGQKCSLAGVHFDDDAVADFFDKQVDAGRKPQEFARIWVHTHPGSSAMPSGTDEETFARCFGKANWAVMFILSQSGETYTRITMTEPARFTVRIQAEIDYTASFPGAASDQWEEEYQQNVIIRDGYGFANRQFDLHSGKAEQAVEAKQYAQRGVVFDPTEYDDLWDETREDSWYDWRNEIDASNDDEAIRRVFNDTDNGLNELDCLDDDDRMRLDGCVQIVDMAKLLDIAAE